MKKQMPKKMPKEMQKEKMHKMPSGMMMKDKEMKAMMNEKSKKVYKKKK